MSVYKPGDEVLIKAIVKRFNHEVNDYAMEGWASSMECTPPESIVGLASEFEQRGTEWIDVRDRMSDVDDVGYCEVTMQNGSVLPAIYLGDGHFGFLKGAEGKHKSVIAWKPFSSAYTPPVFDCKRCQHRLVCRFMHNCMLIEKDKHCCGKHYKPHGEVDHA